MIPSCGGDPYDRLGTSNSEICPLVMMAKKEVLAPLANDPTMLGRSIRSFGHLEHQNPSIISEDIGRARIVQQFWKSRIKGVERSEYSCLR